MMQLDFTSNCMNVFSEKFNKQIMRLSPMRYTITLQLPTILGTIYFSITETHRVKKNNNVINNPNKKT